jgi:hypothetical protein
VPWIGTHHEVTPLLMSNPPSSCVWSGVYSGGAGTFKSVAGDHWVEPRAYTTLLSASSCRNQLINGFELVKIWSTILQATDSKES